MKKITAKPINHQSWILTEWGNRIGVLTNTDNTCALLEASGLRQFPSIKELEKEYDWQIVFEQKEIKEEPVDKIGNIPVKHTSPQNIELDPITSYTKKEGGVRIAAGFWGLKFANGWTPVFCPKLETVNQYESIGPFTSKVEMNTIIAQKNKKEKS